MCNNDEYCNRGGFFKKKLTGTTASLANISKSIKEHRKTAADNKIQYKHKSKPPPSTKDDFLLLLFKAFVKSNRVPTGKTSGKLKYWLNSRFKYLTYHANRQNEKPEASLWQSFIKYVQQLQQLGKY